MDCLAADQVWPVYWPCHLPAVPCTACQCSPFYTYYQSVPLCLLARQRCLRPIIWGILFVIVFASQARCQNPLTKRLLAPLQPARQQFPGTVLPIEGMFCADACCCLLLIAVLFLLIVCASLLWAMLERLHPSHLKVMGKGRRDSNFLGCQGLLVTTRVFLGCLSLPSPARWLPCRAQLQVFLSFKQCSSITCPCGLLEGWSSSSIQLPYQVLGKTGRYMCIIHTSSHVFKYIYMYVCK